MASRDVALTTCFERLAGTEAYSPVLEMLEALMERDANTLVAKLLKLVAPTWYIQIAPLWSSMDPSFAAVLESARVASPERMKRELAAFLGELTTVTPVLLVVDDMHWADASTAELIAYLCRKPGLHVIVCWCPNYNSSSWYGLRLKSKAPLLPSIRSTNDEESQLSEPAMLAVQKIRCKKHYPSRFLQD